MWCAAADDPMGCLSRPLNGCFEIDQQVEAAAGRPSVAFRYGRSLLAGGERTKTIDLLCRGGVRRLTAVIAEPY